MTSEDIRVCAEIDQAWADDKAWHDKPKKPRKRKLRGVDAMEAVRNFKWKGKLNQYRLTRLLHRKGHCAVCDVALVKDDKVAVPARWETVGAWRVPICNTHERVGYSMTINGRIRFHELPPEAAKCGNLCEDRGGTSHRY